MRKFRKFRKETVNENFVIARWADKKKLPLYRGKTINWYREFPLDFTTTPIPEGSATAGQIDFTGQNVEATVDKYAEWFKVTKRLKMTGRDPELKSRTKSLGVAAAHSIDRLLMEEVIKNGSIPIRVDELNKDDSFTQEGVIDTSTGNNSVTFVDASLNETTNNYWAGGHFAVWYPKGTNYGHGSQVSTFTAASDSIVLSNPAKASYDNTSRYRLVVGTDLSASNVLTGAAVKYATSRAREWKFWPWPGGYFRIAYGPQVESDLLDDTVYDRTPDWVGDEIRAGLVKKLWGVEFYRITDPYREDVDGTQNDDGVVFCTPLMGQHAIGIVDLAGNSEPKIVIRIPGSQTVSEPHGENCTMGYVFYMAAKGLNAAFAINIMSGASGVS